jgi:hypothetical protein
MKYKIEIESEGDYSRKVEFNVKAEMSHRDFLALTETVLDFFDDMENGAEIIEPEAEPKA